MVFAEFFNAPPAWEQQIYSNNSKSTDPAIALIGFDDRGPTLYVRSQSQKIYGCKVTWSNDKTATTCFETGPDIIKKLQDPAPCPPIFQTLQPPGNVVSALAASPCRDDEHVQIDFVILSDKSIWRLLQGSGGAGESFADFFTLVTAIAGTVLGLIIGFVISRFARRNHNKHHQRESA
jgi:hypothetical protein